MRLVIMRRATSLSGLSSEQFREWSKRRNLTSADVQNRFHVEFDTHRRLLAALREAPRTTSFLKLCDASVLIYDCETWELVDTYSADRTAVDGDIAHLDPHPAVLATGLAVPSPPPTDQLGLFPARFISAEPARKGYETVAEAKQQPSRGWA